MQLLLLWQQTVYPGYTCGARSTLEMNGFIFYTRYSGSGQRARFISTPHFFTENWLIRSEPEHDFKMFVPTGHRRMPSSLVGYSPFEVKGQKDADERVEPATSYSREKFEENAELHEKTPHCFSMQVQQRPPKILCHCAPDGISRCRLIERLLLVTICWAILFPLL